jgi:hypothetical protein
MPRSVGELCGVRNESSERGRRRAADNVCRKELHDGHHYYGL